MQEAGDNCSGGKEQQQQAVGTHAGQAKGIKEATCSRWMQRGQQAVGPQRQSKGKLGLRHMQDIWRHPNCAGLQSKQRLLLQRAARLPAALQVPQQVETLAA